MTVCFPIVWRHWQLFWPLFILFSLVSGFFLLYRPFKEDYGTKAKVISVISFVILFSTVFFVSGSISTCDVYDFTHRPELVKDFDTRVTSKAQAKQLFRNHFAQKGERYKRVVKDLSLGRLEPAENEETYSLRVYSDKYILYKNGELYREERLPSS